MELPISMKDKDLPALVKELREVMGLTQEQFAAEIGVTVSTVNRWEKGRSKPQPLAVKQIEALQERIRKLK